MITHQEIDLRLFAMVRLCVEKIDSDPSLLALVAKNITRIPDARIRAQWLGLLESPWPEFREKLLDPSETGNQMRQDAPFGGLLSNGERRPFFQRRV